MGHCNRSSKGSLVKQTETALNACLAIGRKKKADKAAGTTWKYIYSWETYRSYLKHCCYFVKWCKIQHDCKTLQECRKHTAEWMETRAHLSAYTQKLEASALAKLYGCSAADLGVQTAKRCRSDIKRSRGDAARDRHFSESRNAELVEFCRSTGLRRSELRALHGSALCMEQGKYYIHVTSGSKGGRERYAPVTGNLELVLRLCEEAGVGKVFLSVPSAADIHSYRADYATRVYLTNARPLEQLQRREIYYCRGDRKGTAFDRAAMRKASQALGHNRISVVGEHYLRL